MKSLKRNLLFGFVLVALLFSAPNFGIANTLLPKLSNDSKAELNDVLPLKIKIKIIIIIKKKKKKLVGEIKGMMSANKGERLGENQYFAEATIEGDKFLLEVAGLKKNLDFIVIPKGFSASDHEVREFDRDMKLKGGSFKPTVNKMGNFEIQDLIIK